MLGFIPDLFFIVSAAQSIFLVAQMILIPESNRLLHFSFLVVFRITQNTRCTGGPQLSKFRTTAAANPFFWGGGNHTSCSKWIKPSQKVKCGPGTSGPRAHGIQNWSCTAPLLRLSWLPPTAPSWLAGTRSSTGPSRGAADSALIPPLCLENLFSAHFVQLCCFSTFS